MLLGLPLCSPHKKSRVSYSKAFQEEDKLKHENTVFSPCFTKTCLDTATGKLCPPQSEPLQMT